MEASTASRIKRPNDGTSEARRLKLLPTYSYAEWMTCQETVLFHCPFLYAPNTDTALSARDLETKGVSDIAPNGYHSMVTARPSVYCRQRRHQQHHTH